MTWRPDANSRARAFLEDSDPPELQQTRDLDAALKRLNLEITNSRARTFLEGWYSDPPELQQTRNLQIACSYVVAAGEEIAQIPPSCHHRVARVARWVNKNMSFAVGVAGGLHMQYHVARAMLGKKMSNTDVMSTATGAALGVLGVTGSRLSPKHEAFCKNPYGNLFFSITALIYLLLKKKPNPTKFEQYQPVLDFLIRGLDLLDLNSLDTASPPRRWIKWFSDFKHSRFGTQEDADEFANQLEKTSTMVSRRKRRVVLGLTSTRRRVLVRPQKRRSRPGLSPTSKRRSRPGVGSTPKASLAASGVPLRCSVLP